MVGGTNCSRVNGSVVRKCSYCVYSKSAEPAYTRRNCSHVVCQTVSFTIHDLCLHPEYVAPLRKELESPEYLEFERTGKGLPLLDSFLKESARLTPVESSK